MTLVRLPDWPERLAALVEERRRAPFEWGRNDCCVFAADAVQAITGVDLAEGLRGLPVREAARLLRGAGGVVGLAAQRLPQAHPGQQRRGDLVAAPVASRGRHVLGVYLGGMRWCAPGADGLVFRTAHDVEHVFLV